MEIYKDTKIKTNTAIDNVFRHFFFLFLSFVLENVCTSPSFRCKVFKANRKQKQKELQTKLKTRTNKNRKS